MNIERDRELLEAAARAAGIRFRKGDYAKGLDTNKGFWNPLDSDADAFRLMVDCELEVSCHDDYVDASGYSGSAVMVEDYGSDKHAATRRAIVRAAAAMSEGQ